MPVPAFPKGMKPTETVVVYTSLKASLAAMKRAAALATGLNALSFETTEELKFLILHNFAHAEARLKRPITIHQRFAAQCCVASVMNT